VTGPEWLQLKLVNLKRHQLSQYTSWAVEFMLTKKLTDMTKGELVIRTNLRHFESFRIPIYVDPQPILLVSPPVLFLNAPASSEVFDAELEIRIPKDAITQDIHGENRHPLTDLNTPCSIQQKPHESIAAAVSPPSFSIEPSNDCIKIKRLVMSPDSDRIKYAITARKCAAGPLNLRIMLQGICVRKVPIVLPVSNHIPHSAE